MNEFTPQQQVAITATGNVLVVAGAGAGKTRTLVERCVARVLDAQSPVGLDEILMVTFTEAAATEMKQRIRQRLEDELNRTPPGPCRIRLEEQLALLDTARIGTLHGFCFQLIRQHFYELEFDPQLTVLPEEQAKLLMEETLDEILHPHYAGASTLGTAVVDLIEGQANGREPVIRELLLKLHHYTQTLADPAGWFEREMAQCRQTDPVVWRAWLRTGFVEWRELWLPVLREQPVENTKTHMLASRLALGPENPELTAAAEMLAEVVAANRDWPRGTKGKFFEPIEGFYTEAAFLHSLAVAVDGLDPLAQDWQWVRGQMETVLRLTQEFSRQFADAKRAQGVVDFHDLEQCALRLLWDTGKARPTVLAEQFRRQFKLVFVDEYQDINAAQDKIIEAVSGTGVNANRFLVGDIKQSIYRFRLANPRIFQHYEETWRNSQDGQVVSLTDNFRSRERLLNFINPLFAELMRASVGGVEYDAEAALKFGAPEQRGQLSTATDPSPRVEVHLRVNGGDTKEPEDEMSADAAIADLAEQTGAEREARDVARRLRELRAEQHQVWDERSRTFRDLQWSDIVILLRSPANQAEAYAKEFHRQGVPLQVARGGFFEGTEITDLLSLLQLLDNPLQDVPLLAVLRSPLVSLTLAELAEIRLANRHGHFWLALNRWHEVHGRTRAATEDAPSSITGEKVSQFLRRFARWRRMARETSLSQRIEAVLNETHYGEWLLATDRGVQKLANVRRLQTLARQFDPFQRQGLSRFLRFVEVQQAAELTSEPAPMEATDTVRVTSIHRSKGLEFPVVVLANLGKKFNLRDLSDSVVLDETYGLCPQVKPPQTGRYYPSLPHWLAGKRQRREMLGEELRLLYVALTRARDTLLLFGTTTEKKIQAWSDQAARPPSDHQILAARNFLDWLGPWWARQTGDSNWAARANGETNLFRWFIHGENEGDELPLPADNPGSLNLTKEKQVLDPARLEQLRHRLTWQYPFAAATREPAKTSVSALRRRKPDESDEETRPLYALPTPRLQLSVPKHRADGKLTAAEIGTAHHLFLQLLNLEQAGSELELKRQAEDVRHAGAISEAQMAVLDFTALTGFWQSELGHAIRAQPLEKVHRELPFTARLSPADLVELKLPTNSTLPADEFFVVQGVVDLAVILPEEIWLLDFKTDQVNAAELAETVTHYEPQIKLYARALARIYRRPVTQCWLHFLSLQLSERVG